MAAIHNSNLTLENVHSDFGYIVHFNAAVLTLSRAKLLLLTAIVNFAGGDYISESNCSLLVENQTQI